MGILKGARTGLLLLLTAGPILVFLFLYTFGKNHFELDTYPLKRPDFCQFQDTIPEALLFIDSNNPSKQISQKAFSQQKERLRVFWEKISSSPVIVPIKRIDSSDRLASTIPNGLVYQKAEFWLSADTVLEIQSAKGLSRKRLPAPPRAFLFDKNQNLRGVYGLCIGLSVDTLMLEYKILTDH